MPVENKPPIGRQVERQQKPKRLKTGNDVAPRRDVSSEVTRSRERKGNPNRAEIPARVYGK